MCSFSDATAGMQPNASEIVLGDTHTTQEACNVSRKEFSAWLGGAAVVASGVAGTASTASAQTVAAGVGACEYYAHEYAAVNTPRYGDWNTAYRFAYNECLTSGPDFVAAGPYD